MAASTDARGQPDPRSGHLVLWIGGGLFVFGGDLATTGVTGGIYWPPP